MLCFNPVSTVAVSIAILPVWPISHGLVPLPFLTTTVHKDMKSHMGAVMTMASGAVISLSTEQKVNAHSSTEAQLVAVDDVMAKILWTKKFIEWQGSEVKLNILYQDNTSMMKLEMNGKTSCGKRTTHFDIKYFMSQI